MESRARALAATAVAAALWAAYPSAASAGGLEYTGQGAIALGRGGAVAARAEDPMVLAHNPAGLAELRGSHFLINLNLALFDACVQPSGFYGWGNYLGGLPTELPDPEGEGSEVIPLGVVTDEGQPAETDYYLDPFDEVCLEQNSTPIPQIAWTARPSERFGIGLGLIFPAVTPGGQWGGDNAVIRGDDGELRPAPTRYMAYKSSSLGVFPTIGVGYRFTDWLRAGLALEWGILAANVFVVAASLGGTTPTNDQIAQLKAQDYFIPALTLSTHLVPDDAWDVVVAFRFQDDIDARGDLDITTGVFDPDLTPHKTSNIPITSVRQPMPWKLRAGVRYADRFLPRLRGTGAGEMRPSSRDVLHDPLQDERWDLELDVEWQMNGRVDTQSVHYAGLNKIIFEPSNGDPEFFIAFPNEYVPFTEVDKHWRDQLSVRLGGTYNVLPGQIGLSSGLHYETRGVDPAYMQIDFWPLARLGVHGGVIVRLARRIDLVFSYAHIFQETLVVAAPPHRSRIEIGEERYEGDEVRDVREIDKEVGTLVDRAGTGMQVLEEEPLKDPDAVARFEQPITQTTVTRPPYIVNAGTYRSAFDVLAVGLNVHF